MSVDARRAARVALACLVEPGLKDIDDLVRAVGPVEALALLRDGGVSARLQQLAAPRLARVHRAGFGALVDEMMARTDRIGARIITPDDEEWPYRLDDLRRVPAVEHDRTSRDMHPPICLWLRGTGRLDAATACSVAVVGARASTPYGDHVAREISYGLADQGWTVLSGGAYGIDAAAHRGAITGGGPTVAVLASGVDRTYPPSNAGLFDRILDGGLLVSEWPPGADPHRHRFLIRNRVIAALTLGTVVVEAAARSGARQTAGRARRLGRPTMAVPGPVTSAMSVGTNQMLRELDVRPVTTAAEVIEEVGRIGDDLAPVPRGPVRERDRLHPAYAQVLDGVPPTRGSGPEAIAAAAGVPLRTVLQALPTLRDTGFVVEDDSGWRLTPARR